MAFNEELVLSLIKNNSKLCALNVVCHLRKYHGLEDSEARRLMCRMMDRGIIDLSQDCHLEINEIIS